MKHLILFCLFLIGGVSFSPAQGVVQGEDAGSESPVYQSFFGQDSTLWYIAGTMYTDYTFFYLYQKGGKRTYFDGLGYAGVHFWGDCNVLGSIFDPIISRDNSKVWVVLGEDTCLVCDFNLGIGDSLIYSKTKEKIAVDKVFWEDGLKHIQFKLKLLFDSPDVFKKYEIVEGIGTLYPDLYNDAYYFDFASDPDYEFDHDADGTPILPYEGAGSGCQMIRSVYKDDKLVYKHPDWPEYWDYLEWVGVEKHSTDLLSVSGEDHEILIEDSGCLHSGEEVVISDKDGRVWRRAELDGETLRISLDGCQPGLYFVKIGTRYTTKIWVR